MSFPQKTRSEETECELWNHYESTKSDPNLKGITSLADLHLKLRELSLELRKQDQKSASVFSQLTFAEDLEVTTNDNGIICPNPVFKPNVFKKDVSTEGRKITSHYRYAIKSEEHVINALESCDKEPSKILYGNDCIYLGGFKCVGNIKFVKENNISLIINTAKNLEDFFPKFKDMRKMLKEPSNNINVLDLNWIDGPEQELEEELVRDTIKTMCKEKNSILVHCAQGKSRSSTLVIAYLCVVVENLTVEKALELVQKSRRMAQPNANFMSQLLAYEKNGLFLNLKKEMSTNQSNKQY